MKKGALTRIFLRSFFIHAALNFRRMQNIGLAYALIPLLEEQRFQPKDQAETLARNLQMFNTHPYLSGPLIGSIARMEEDRPEGGDASAITMVKQSLMGPYAAIGDTFFWGALRPCAGLLAAALAWMGWIMAPVAFLLLYTPAHVWIRMKGFIEGYRRGKLGIEFIRRIDLPRVAGRIRWLSLMLLSVFGSWLVREGYGIFVPGYTMIVAAGALTVILICWFLIRKGVSQVYILYGAVLILLLFSSRDLLMWWK